ncbi:MAG: hypothetical protein JWP18_923, partial [Solirubrobacterales bacterium]|nr:hypothetical protein [Solirubrobacterales bacterium]
ERANRICAQGDRAAQKLATRIGRAQRGSDPEVVFRRLAELTAEAAATTQGALDRLAALTPPAGDEDELKAWLADQRRRQSLRRTLAQAFDRRDETAISTLSQRIAALGATTAAFADRYGVGRCARVAG